MGVSFAIDLEESAKVTKQQPQSLTISRQELLVYGYIRLNSFIDNIPVDIIRLCSHHYDMSDKWDEKNSWKCFKHSTLSIVWDKKNSWKSNVNCSMIQLYTNHTDTQIQNAFGVAIIKKGQIQKWRIKFNYYGTQKESIYIGIENASIRSPSISHISSHMQSINQFMSFEKAQAMHMSPQRMGYSQSGKLTANATILLELDLTETQSKLTGFGKLSFYSYDKYGALNIQIGDEKIEINKNWCFRLAIHGIKATGSQLMIELTDQVS